MSTRIISVVVATYNRAGTIMSSLESILAQKDVDLELVVVDDGSTDSTEDVIRNIGDARVQYIKIPENKGASYARNKGIQEARGEWILVWDSDDTLDPNALKTLSDVLNVHPDTVVVSAPARMVQGNTVLSFDDRPEGHVSLEKIVCKYLSYNEKIRMARKSAYLKAPYVAHNIDFVVAARLATQGPWFHVGHLLGSVLVNNPDSLTRERKKFNLKRSAERAPHLVLFMNEFGEVVRTHCFPRYVALAYGTARSLISARAFLQARTYAAIAFRHVFWNVRYALLYFVTILFGVFQN